MNQRGRRGGSETASLRSQRAAIREKALATLEKSPIDLNAERVLMRMRKFAETAANKEEFYRGAHEAIIWECLRIWPGEPAFKDFFEHSTGAPEKAWHYSARVGSVADPLFKLRGIDGFDVICRRLIQQRSLKDAASELYAAGTFFDAGFLIKVKPKGIKKKGEDFDFEATKDGCTVNVEASNLEGPEYSSDAVRAKLNRKRTQLPADGANVLFIFAPEEWFKDSDVNAFLAGDAEWFLTTKTNRINAVVFMNERHEYFGGGFPLVTGMLGFEFSAMKKNTARAPAEVLNVFVDRSLHWENRLSTEEQIAARFTQRRNIELYEWADQFWNQRHK